MAKTYKDFQEFYEHPVIKKIAKNQKWTVSDKDKCPLDVTAYLKDNVVWGLAWNRGYNPCVTLEDLCISIPNAANNCYYLDAITDRIVILDIEPSCPDDLKQKFLELPYIYGETSMSGKGYHLIFELPSDIFRKYPNASDKLALQDENREYEILLNHMVTFTRNMIPPATGTDIEPFMKLFEELCAKQKPKVRSVEFDMDKKEPTDIPDMDRILTHLVRQTYKDKNGKIKRPEDFTEKGVPDHSRYEFGYAGFLLDKLNKILDVYFIKNNGHEYTMSEKAWFIYWTLKNCIEPRAKHEEMRNGMPWLLYIATTIVGRNEKIEEKAK